MILQRLLLVQATAVAGFSASSSFAGTRTSSRMIHTMGPWTMYNNPADPPNNPHSSWSVLSNTEEWISTTLASSNAKAGASNPYARKEVSYVCEQSAGHSMVVSGIFRLLKEARETGEAHGEREMERAESQGSKYEPATLRQTQVCVIPNALANFAIFDLLVQSINQARRNARDYVTDLDDDSDEAMFQTAINCAHMHPQYGDRTPQQKLQDMKEEERAGEVDVNLEEYKKTRLAARRSPYPTVVIEVRASPVPDFGETPPPPPTDSDDQISMGDIQKLEALFGKTAHMSTSKPEDSFWDAVGNSIEEVVALTPMKLAEEWMARNVPTDATAALVELSSPHMDAAYEFVFLNMAMVQETKHTHYLVMPQTLSRAATSLEKWVDEIRKIVNILPDLHTRVEIQTFHPEHVDSSCRSPVPILAISWNDY